MQPVQQQYNEAKLVNKVTTKATGISALLNNPHFKLSALFLQYALPIFEKANAFLQKDEPVIHILHDVLISQLSDLLARFINPETILSAKFLTDIDLTSIRSQKPDDDLSVGVKARDFIKDNQKSIDLPSLRLSEHFTQIHANI